MIPPAFTKPACMIAEEQGVGATTDSISQRWNGHWGGRYHHSQ